MLISNETNNSIQLVPVGFIRNKASIEDWDQGFSEMPWEKKMALMEEHRDAVSEIVVNEELEDILDGIEEYSHLNIYFWPHQVPAERRSTLKVHPLGNPQFPLVGVFATRSPVRPNPILETTVRLIERKGNILKVSGLDALDGSPLLDIKPYNPDPNTGEIQVPGWMKQVRKQFKHKKS